MFHLSIIFTMQSASIEYEIYIFAYIYANKRYNALIYGKVVPPRLWYLA